jgi:ribosomal protein S6
MAKMFYKIALLFKGGLTEEEGNAEYVKVTEELKTHGIILQEIKPTKIGLAYPISKSTEAYFATVKFEPTEGIVVDFKSWLKKANVLRVLITKNDNLTVEKVAGFTPATIMVEEIPEIALETPAITEEEIPEIIPITSLEIPVVEEKPVFEEKPEVDMNALDEKLEELLK